jgi:hypothetical protein
MIIDYTSAWCNFNMPAMQEEESINKTMATPLPNNYNHEGLKFAQVQN